MLVPDQVRHAYSNTSMLVDGAAEKVRSTLRPFCSEHDYDFHERIKSLPSVAEKIESGRYSSWDEIDDLYGCMVVVSLASEESKVLEYLRDSFIETGIKLKSDPKPPDVFRFDSTRFHGKLRPPAFFRGPLEESVYSIEFEIQIKTVLDYAWSKTNHALVFKADNVDWRNLRLTAQLKAVVDQVDMLVLSFEESADSITDCTWPNISDKVAIEQLFRKYFSDEQIPGETKPKDWSRFSENVYRALQAFSGQKVDGNAEERLEQQLAYLVSAFDTYLAANGHERFPRSLSLLQVVVGVLGTCGDFSGRDDAYSLPIGSGMRELFPGLILPGPEFKTD